MCLGNQSKFGLFGAGYLSGIVTHGGNEAMEITTIFDGIKINHATHMIPRGGSHLVSNLNRYMQDDMAMPMNVSQA